MVKTIIIIFPPSLKNLLQKIPFPGEKITSGSLPTLSSVSNISLPWKNDNPISRNMQPQPATCPAVAKDYEAYLNGPEGVAAQKRYLEEVGKPLGKAIGNDTMQGRKSLGKAIENDTMQGRKSLGIAIGNDTMQGGNVFVFHRSKRCSFELNRIK